MIKKSLKAKNIFKGAVFGVALVMCGSFVPVGALQVLAETWKETSDEQQVSNNTNRIEIAGDSYQNVVEKGEEFSIPTASYYGKSTSPHIIGSAVSSTITESKVVAYYEADNQIVYDSSKDEYSGNKFEATRIGTYVVEYTVVDNGIKYSHKIELKCIVNEVEFNFDSNSANIIPSIYDLSLMQDEKKDIVLPIPTVEDEDDNAFEDLKIYLDGEDATEQEYLKISLDNAFSSDVKIQKDSDGNFYIDGDSLVGANGHEFRIIYKFYQNGVQVASTEKTFKVYDKYYTQKDGKAGYSLSIPKLTYPTSAVVGEPTKVKLPTAIATTSDDDSPANESVNVSYKIEVYKEGKDNNWNLIEENTIDEENRFIAPSEGNYKFVYVVTDFYGHESRDFTFYIRNVKDTSPATPYMYDAGDTNAENEDGSYKSAESILKSQTVNRNIIIYAIGGNDNAVSKEDLTLTREVRNATGSVIYKITSYNEYNLIFQPSKDGTEEKGLYKSIYDDNYQIRRQMILRGETRIDEETIKQWLIDHNYLIVVSDRVTSPTGEQFKDDGSEMTDEELLAEGFAYIEANSSNAKFTEQTYSVYYIADDNVDGNGSKEIYFNFEVKSSVEDSVAPVILHSTEFQSSYLENDVITLKEPTASDESGDSSVELHTAYRYLDSERNPIVESGEEIQYIYTGSQVAGKWYTQSGENNIVTSSGWTILENQDEYQIKLKNKPANAAYIEIFSYAIDDQGNVGFYDKQIYVSNINDEKAPSLYQVVNAPEADGGYVNNQTIVLPTLYYQDNLPQYMNAGVVVYKIEDGEQIVVHSSNMSTYYDSFAGNFVLEAGTFNASTGGDYLVAVTVTDAGKNSITTYFKYDVDSVPVVQDPEITNISAQNKEIVIGESQIMAQPKLSVSDDEDIDYIGLSEYDSETVASYYTISVQASDNSDYKLTSNEFVANSRGTYKLQYNVFVISYSNRTEYFSATGTENGKLFLKTNDVTGATMLAYKADGNETLLDASGNAQAGDTFYIFLQKTEESYELRINTQTDGLGDEIALSDLPQYTNGETVVKLHNKESEIITFTAGEVAVNLNMDESAYEKRKYETLDQTIIIKPIDADVSGSGTIDKDNSNVSISVSTGNTTRTIGSISINDWNNKKETNTSDLYFDDNGNLMLKLNTNGTYTIKYTVKAKDANGMSVGSEQTISYELSVGDVIAPEIEIDNDSNQFIKSKYEIGNIIDFNVAYITATDNKTDEETLKDNLVITVKNTSTGKTTTLGANESFEVEEEGSYTVSIYVKDDAGNSSVTKEFTFTVGDDTSSPINVTEVIGKVLIGVSAVILGGVVVYFIVSKAKESKKKNKR